MTALETDLFSNESLDPQENAQTVSNSPYQPLASKMRPVQLADFVGQEHLLGVDSALKKTFEQGALHSMILWGPPGTGKTTLATMLARQSQCFFATLSAVSAGVKDIREVVSLAKLRQGQGIQTVLFVDEVHRFNKSQQDALLPHIEDGLFIFIGATTENPSFELNNALLSRTAIYVLKALSHDAISKLIRTALNEPVRGLGALNLTIEESALNTLAKSAAGDARAALGRLELAAQFAAMHEASVIDDAVIEEVLKENFARFDKKGDTFYEQISALHKSVRGSSADAALYWLARMLTGGCDPLYIARRIVRMASEDIGNADPRALSIALDAWQAQTQLGSPEGELSLAQAVVYLAVAPKSNAVYKAFNAAMQAAKEHGAEDVPMHLRNAPTGLMKSLDYGAEYHYAHDAEHAYVPGEEYLPETMQGQQFYAPTDRGLEAKIQQRLRFLKSLDQQSDFRRYTKK